MERALYIATLAAALASGLIAGIFFAFSNFVMGALGRIQPAQGIAAMQSINVTVLNPLFLSIFAGTAILSGILVLAAFPGWTSPRSLYLIAGGLLYAAGCFGVTMMFNVPLNDTLAAMTQPSEDGAKLWAHYLSAWTTWNTVRTIASLLASAFFILALS